MIQEVQQSLGKADHTTYVGIREAQCPNSSHEESDLSEVTQFHACHVNGTLTQKPQ